jgi:hypothetical protein
MEQKSEIEQLLELIEVHEARSDSFQKELDSIHVEWQRDRGRYIRLESQIEALVSLLGEMAAHSGVSADHVATCFRQRYLYFQEQHLLEYEKVAPDLAAQIDNRVQGEISTNQNFLPLFENGD